MKIWRELLGYVKVIVIVVVITLVINNVVLINAKIPSPSMEKTLMVKDRLFGFRLAYGINLDLFGYKISEKFKDPERFDIVIFKYPDDESRLFIKRVIGLPGEVVEIKDGKVYIDGSPLHWMTLSFRRKWSEAMARIQFRKIVISCLVITGMIRKIHVHGKTNSCDLTSLWEKLL